MNVGYKNDEWMSEWRDRLGVLRCDKSTEVEVFPEVSWEQQCTEGGLSFLNRFLYDSNW